MGAATTTCVICNKKVTCWGGHVHRGNGEKIIAGFCDEHFDDVSQIEGCKGCYGNLRQETEVNEHWSSFGYLEFNENKTVRYVPLEKK